MDIDIIKNYVDNRIGKNIAGGSGAGIQIFKQ